MAKWSVAECGVVSQHRTYLEQHCDAMELLYSLGPVEVVDSQVAMTQGGGAAPSPTAHQDGGTVEMPLSTAHCRAVLMQRSAAGRIRHEHALGGLGLLRLRGSGCRL